MLGYGRRMARRLGDGLLCDSVGHYSLGGKVFRFVPGLKHIEKPEDDLPLGELEGGVIVSTRWGRDYRPVAKELKAC